MAPAHLEISDHLGERSIPLETTCCTIGSERSNVIRLGGPGIARHHAEIVTTDTGYVLRSRDQQSGTYLNGELVTGDCELYAGDRIRLGRGNGADLAIVAPAVILTATLPTGDTIEHRLMGRATIGRSLACDVVIPDMSVSRKHGVIRRRGGLLSIEATSTRAVTVNGVRVSGPAPFAYGDQIAVGACVASVAPEPERLSSIGEQEDTGSHRIGAVTAERALGQMLGDPTAFERREDLRRALPDVLAHLETIELRRQLTVARSIQRTLLPAAGPVFAGYRLFGESQPCYAVGGDFFDFIELSGGAIGLVLGDVSGKGLGAALLAHFTQAAIRTALRYERDVAKAVAAVNSDLCQRSLPNHFVTACVGVFDPTSGRLRYVNAGHCPPLYVRRDSEPQFLTGGDMTLGVLSNSSYRTNDIQLDRDSAVLLYSDGFTECTNGDDVEFGPERLASFFGARPTSAPEAILEELDRHLEEFGVRGIQADDMTLLLLQREG